MIIKKVITKKDFINKLAELIKLAVYINAETDADIFISIMGQVDIVNLHYNIDGFDKAINEARYSTREDDIYLYNTSKPDWVPFDSENDFGNVVTSFKKMDSKIKELIKLANDKGLDLGILY